MKIRKHRRCFKRQIVAGNVTYSCRFNVNHSLIEVYPAIDPKLMSFYRGTSPAALWDLAADLGGYVVEPENKV